MLVRGKMILPSHFVRTPQCKKLLDICKIDLLKLADDAKPIVADIQEFFMRDVAEKDKRFNLKAECEYLGEIGKRVILINATAWYVFSYTGVENVEVGLPYIGGVLGFGVDYHRLDWQMYKVLGDWMLT